LKIEKGFEQFIEKRALEVRIITNYDQFDPSEILVNYQLESYSESQFTIQLNITEPQLISIYSVSTGCVTIYRRKMFWKLAL
jgi:hypothetical protein